MTKHDDPRPGRYPKSEPRPSARDSAQKPAPEPDFTDEPDFAPKPEHPAAPEPSHKPDPEEEQKPDYERGVVTHDLAKEDAKALDKADKAEHKPKSDPAHEHEHDPARPLEPSPEPAPDPAHDPAYQPGQHPPPAAPPVLTPGSEGANALSPEQAEKPPELQPAHPPEVKGVRGHRLRADEVQHIADLALEAWKTGVPGYEVDSTGDRWEFEPIRDEQSRLVIRRFTPPEYAETGPYEDALIGQNVVAAFEFGLENARVLVTARVQAAADPA